MRRWYDYRASDFDLSAHRADVQIDLQQIDLPDASLDVVLSAHVLEHVPDTHRALSELFRVLSPRGRLYLQIPLAWGRTFVPPEPTFHADNTPVFFNFGWDLTDQIRSAGFITTALVPQGHLDAVRAGPCGHDPDSDGFDLDEMVTHARIEDLAAVATLAQQRTLGFEPPWQHVTWECIRP
jgi:SAM-dependent methyltransferase